MKMIKFECPDCKANLKIEADRKMAFCQYCGCQVYLDDGVKRSEHVVRKVDEARIKEAETKKEIKIKEIEYKDRRNRRESRSSFLEMFFFIAVFGFSIGLLLFWSKEVQKDTDEFNVLVAQMEEQGLISAGAASDYKGKNYDAVVAQLKAAGFSNIETYDQNDAGLFSKDDGKVDTISVNGRSDFQRRDFFEPTAKIIISYH